MPVPRVTSPPEQTPCPNLGPRAPVLAAGSSTVSQLPGMSLVPTHPQGAVGVTQRIRVKLLVLRRDLRVQHPVSEGVPEAESVRRLVGCGGRARRDTRGLVDEVVTGALLGFAG